MPKGRYVNVGAVEHGVVCPECAGPKTEQAMRCKPCYDAMRRNGYYVKPPTPARKPRLEKPSVGRGRPQPQSHPWRKAEKLRLSGAR